MFDEHADEPLQRAHERPVDHDRPVLGAIVAGVGHVEPFRQVEVHLDGGALPRAAQLVLDLDIDLGAVEHAFARVDLVLQRFFLQGEFQRLGGTVPMLVRAHRFLRSGGQVDIVLVEAEGAENVQVQVDDVEDFLFQLVRPAEDVGIVLGEAAHPHQAVQGAGALVAVDRAQFTPADGELAVAVLVGVEHPDVEGAVHRLELVQNLVDLHGGIHVLAVEIEVAGGLPQILAGDVRRVQQLVAVAVVLVLPVVLQQPAQERAPGLPEDEARTDLVLNGEQAQLFAELAVVALAGLFQTGEICLQFLLVGKGGAVDAGEHLPLFIAAPVGTGHPQQLEHLEPGRIGHVRTAAEVDERTMAIEAHPVDVHVAEQLDLVTLTQSLEKADRLVPPHLFAHEGQAGSDDLGHLGLDLFEILRRKGLVPVEIVIEAVFDGRTDGDLHLVAVQFLDGQGHDVGGGMAENLESRLGRHGHRFDDGILGERRGQFQQPAVVPDSYGLFSFLPGNKRLQRFDNRRAVRKGLDFTIL